MRERGGGVGCGGLKPAAWGCENGEETKAWIQVDIFSLSPLLPHIAFRKEIRDAGVWGGGGGRRV